MNTFLKAVLLVIAAIVALKLLPFAWGVMCFLVATTFGLIGFGVSALTAVLGGLLLVAALLSPIWVPILLIVGIIALVRRGSRSSALPTS